MTVAPETLVRPALSGGLRLRLGRRAEHALIVLGICLPVPVFAATGLSIPLPTSVERLAAALVPWADDGALDDGAGLTVEATGSIVRVPGETLVPALAVPSPATNPRPTVVSTPPSERGGGGGDSTGKGEEGSGSGGGAGSGSSGGSGGSGGSGTEEPTDPSSPVNDVVGQVDETTQPIVDDVEDTVTDVVDDTTGTLDGVLDGLGK